MKDPNLSEQEHADPRSLALRHFGTESFEQSFHIRPPNGPAGRPSEDQFQGGAVSAAQHLV
ncbi:hypothetical protein [Enterovirga aerilata]|uniref:hypothetical protein n=1 Tax=Enterovirga aerilata TaxID=2730920 RepID=UPI003211DF0B